MPFANKNEVRATFGHGCIISDCSKNHHNSVALIVASNQKRGRIKNDGIRIWHIDGPNENFKEDYKNLCNKRPDLIGKFVIFRQLEQGADLGGCIAKRAIFSEAEEEL